ncbi:HAD-IC family P-type ATPase [Streptomyces sp. ME19-01-6]|nr:HAD-IC family P-type ATPase [Streptomyces sp. ME19-01-6]MDX3228519.1 HAD-IC family P-type ATPase [Streptomyces sp. ME19-01-6]
MSPRPGPKAAVADQERRRLLLTAVPALPVLVLCMVPAAQFRNWQWLCFVLAAPVAVWGAWPFHQRALRGLPPFFEGSVASAHALPSDSGAPLRLTHHTLVSAAVVASFSWSTYALFRGGAGEPGTRLPFDPLATTGGGAARPCLEVVAGITLVALAGRVLEARAGQGGASAGRPADAVAGAGAPAVAAVTVTVLGFWFGAGAEPRAAVATAVAVLVMACPCVLVAGVQAALLAAARRGARSGVLVRRPRALEAPRAADTVVLGAVRRPGGYRAVCHLKRLGLRPVLATGERGEAARAVADQLGIVEVHSGVGPRDKADLVRRLRERGHRVVVLGDGAGDAAALSEADLGIAFGDGSEVAAADMALAPGDIEAVVHAVRLARRTVNIIRAHLAWVLGCHLVAVAWAATGRLGPAGALAAMAAGSLLVVCDSLRPYATGPRGAARTLTEVHGSRRNAP